jgi:hypothetical protein
LFIFSDIITSFRSSFNIDGVGRGQILDSVYVESLVRSFVILTESPFGARITSLDLLNNEVYWSRFVMYFGLPLSVVFLCLWILAAWDCKPRNDRRDLMALSTLALFVSSFHYPSLIYYPLSIIIPFYFALLSSRRANSY